MCYIGELENTMLQMYLKGSRLHAWLSSPECPQAIQECKILLDHAYEVHDSDIHGTELHTSAKSLDLPADLKVLIGQGAAVLHSYMGVVYSRATTHLGNSLVLFYPQGNCSSPPVPGSIKHIYELDGTTTLAIQWQHALGGNNADLDPFAAYPHFPASTYSSTLSETLEVVEMTWVHVHYACWAVSNDCVVVLSLSWVYLPSQVSCIILTNLSCRINTCVLSCLLPCTMWQLWSLLFVLESDMLFGVTSCDAGLTNSNRIRWHMSTCSVRCKCPMCGRSGQQHRPLCLDPPQI